MTNPSTRLAELLGELRQILEYERSILVSGNPARISVVVERKLLIAEMIERECKTPSLTVSLSHSPLAAIAAGSTDTWAARRRA